VQGRWNQGGGVPAFRALGVAGYERMEVCPVVPALSAGCPVGPPRLFDGGGHVVVPTALAYAPPRAIRSA
jgi:hypothetical protein